MYLARVTVHSSPQYDGRGFTCDRIERRVTKIFTAFARKETIVEKAYWLGRKRASLKAALTATNSIARLIHLDLAGRYSVKANVAGTRSVDLATSLPPAICAPRNK
jgi:hypothetical protein